MRNPLRALAAASLVLGPTVLAFFSGGFFDRPRLVAGIVAWLLAAVAMVVAPRPLPRSRTAWIALAGLALLTLWTGLSYEWAPLGERAQADFQRLLGYAGFFIAGVALLRGPLARRLVEPALALGTFVVTAYGLSPRLVPDLVDLSRSQSADGRLEQPLTYWNAMGCLAAMGLLLCVRIAADGRRGRAPRAAAAAGAPLLATGLYLSFSRGALLALFAGLVLLLILVPSPRAHARAALVLLGAGAVAALVSSLLPRVESLAPGQGAQAGQGLLMLTALVVLSLAAAVLTGRSAPPVTEPREGGFRLARPAAAAALLLLVVGSLVAAALLESTPAAPTGSATSAKRFGSTDTARYAYWGVTLDAFADHPLRGLGSGGFAVAWRSEPGRSERAVDAHSLYLETLAELGIVGGVFLVLFLGGVAASVARLHARDPAAAAGPAAALLVYAVHAGLDWDWEMPALTGVALVLAASAVAWQDEPAE